MSTSTALSTNQRLVAAVVRLLPLGDLPYRDEVIALSESPTGYAARRLAEDFLGLAEKRCAEITQPLYALAEKLARHAIHAGYLAFPLRAAAQGDRRSAPHRHVWELLVAVLTCLVIETHRAPDAALAREKLLTDVTGVAAALTGL